jgi:hypothetical protein
MCLWADNGISSGSNICCGSTLADACCGSCLSGQACSCLPQVAQLITQVTHPGKDVLQLL